MKNNLRTEARLHKANKQVGPKVKPTGPHRTLDKIVRKAVKTQERK